MEKVIKYLKDKLDNIENHITLFGDSTKGKDQEDLIDAQFQFTTAIEVLKGSEWNEESTCDEQNDRSQNVMPIYMKWWNALSEKQRCKYTSSWKAAIRTNASVPYKSQIEHWYNLDKKYS